MKILWSALLHRATINTSVVCTVSILDQNYFLSGDISVLMGINVASFEFNRSMKQTGNFINCKQIRWQFQSIIYDSRLLPSLKNNFQLHVQLHTMLCDKYLLNHAIGICETSGNAAKSIMQLEALGQYTPPPRHVLLVSRYGS